MILNGKIVLLCAKKVACKIVWCISKVLVSGGLQGFVTCAHCDMPAIYIMVKVLETIEDSQHFTLFVRVM